MRRSLALLAIGLSVVFTCACGSGGGGDASADTTPTTVEPGNAKITTFVVPAAVPCPTGSTFVTVPVQYAASGADRMKLLVDGRQVKLDGTQGEAKADVHCDPLPHTFVVVAYDSAGGRTVEQKLLNTNL